MTTILNEQIEAGDVVEIKMRGDVVTTLVLPPFAGAWLPNGLFFLATVVLFIRMNRL